MNAPSFSLSRTALGLVLACLSAGVGCDAGSKSAVHAPPPAPTVSTVVVQAPSVPSALAQRPATPPGPPPPPAASPTPATPLASPPPAALGAPGTQVTPNAPVDPAGTVAVPVPPPLPGPVADVVELARGGVDEGVITEYIANIRQPFAFGASQIVYLNDLGVSSNVLHGLMRQSALLRPEGNPAVPPAPAAPPTATGQNVTVVPPAAPEPQAPATTIQGTPPPPPGSATTTVVAPAASPTVVNQQVFYQSLAPYGSWVQVPSYGWCWQPTVAVVNTTWQPYCDGGSWLWTDAGWYWSSTYSWGWAPFHYGRWHHSARIGWVWHPGYDWAPAWVAWRSSPAHCGWAPLPPECRWNASVGFSWINGSTAVSVGFGIGATAWYATTWDRFCDPHLHHHRLPRQRVERFVQESNLQVAGGNGVNIRGDNNTVIINNGISREEVQRHTRDEIRRTALRDVDSPATAQGLAAGAAATSGRPNPTGGGRPTEVAVYRPKVPVHDAQPPETVLRRQELTRPAPLRTPGSSGSSPSTGRIGIDPSANRPLPVPAQGGSLNPNRPAPPTAAGRIPASSMVAPTGPSTIPSRPAPGTGIGAPTERATRTVIPPARPPVGVPGTAPQASTPRIPGNPSSSVPSSPGLNPSRPPETRTVIPLQGTPSQGPGTGIAPTPGGAGPGRTGLPPAPIARPLPAPTTTVPSASVPPGATPGAIPSPATRTVVVPGAGVPSRPAGSPPTAQVPTASTPSRPEAYRAVPVPAPVQIPTRGPSPTVQVPSGTPVPPRPVPQTFPRPAPVAPSSAAPAISLPPAAVQSRPVTVNPAPSPAFNPAGRPVPTPVPVQAVPSFAAPQPATRPGPAPVPTPAPSAPGPSARPGPRRTVDQ